MMRSWQEEITGATSTGEMNLEVQQMMPSLNNNKSRAQTGVAMDFIRLLKRLYHLYCFTLTMRHYSLEA